MAVDFYIKRGDTYPPIQATLSDASGSAINLTGASVLFKMRLRDTGAIIVSAAATIVTAASGIVSYAWDAADTAVAGEYLAEWEVTLSSGRIVTCPNDGYLVIKIDGDLP